MKVHVRPALRNKDISFYIKRKKGKESDTTYIVNYTHTHTHTHKYIYMDLH